MNNIIEESPKQKVYTFPDRKFFGEYDSIQLIKLRTKYVKGEIPEQLCYILSTDEALIWDKFSNPDRFDKELLGSVETQCLKELLDAQMELRKKSRPDPLEITQKSVIIDHSMVLESDKCLCKLPYVHNFKNVNRCVYCNKEQKRFIESFDKPISVKRNFKGDEFEKGDIVEVVGGTYCCLVEILNYIPNGWYAVKLPNGGVLETQILGDKIQ